MNFGIYIPNGGDFADPKDVAELARAAERSGWDGFFIWDHLLLGPEGTVPAADVWVELAAVAVATEHIKIGPLIVPLARRRVQVVAKQVVTLDRLSNGRLILGAGLGVECDFARFGESTNLRTRGSALDDSLGILKTWWAGGEVLFDRGADGVRLVPGPKSPAGIPVWVGGSLPERSSRPLKRAVREAGFFPVGPNYSPTNPVRSQEYAQLSKRLDMARQEGKLSPEFDLVVAARSGDGVEAPETYASSGVTWWLESFDSAPGELEAAHETVAEGPGGGWRGRAD